VRRDIACQRVNPQQPPWPGRATRTTGAKSYQHRAGRPACVLPVESPARASLGPRVASSNSPGPRGGIASPQPEARAPITARSPGTCIGRHTILRAELLAKPEPFDGAEKPLSPRAAARRAQRTAARAAKKNRGNRRCAGRSRPSSPGRAHCHDPALAPGPITAEASYLGVECSLQRPDPQTFAQQQITRSSSILDRGSVMSPDGKSTFTEKTFLPYLHPPAFLSARAPPPGRPMPDADPVTRDEGVSTGFVRPHVPPPRSSSRVRPHSVKDLSTRRSPTAKRTVA